MVLIGTKRLGSGMQIGRPLEKHLKAVDDHDTREAVLHKVHRHSCSQKVPVGPYYDNRECCIKDIDGIDGYSMDCASAHSKSE